MKSSNNTNDADAPPLKKEADQTIEAAETADVVPPPPSLPMTLAGSPGRVTVCYNSDDESDSDNEVEGSSEALKAPGPPIIEPVIAPPLTIDASTMPPPPMLNRSRSIDRIKAESGSIEARPGPAHPSQS